MVEQLVRFCGPQSCAGGSSLLLGVVSTMSVVLVRLRTGHNRLNAHMNRRFKLAPSPTCFRGQEDQTAQNILRHCPLLQAEQKHVWPTAILLTIKFFGCRQEQEKMASFITIARVTAKKKI